MSTSNETNVGTSPEKDPEQTTTRAKRRELQEVRIRWKLAGDTAKKATQDRKELKARMDALSAELKPASSDAEAAAEG